MQSMTDKEYKALTVREFSKAARVYETDDAGVYKMCRKDYPDVLAELEKEEFCDLLDCGCGTAPMLTLLQKRYPERHYTGIDLTPEMIEAARAKKLPGVELVVGDCEDLPFPAESFDVVICCQSFHHYPNVQRFFDSVYRVLRPGGRLILRDMTAKSAPMRWFFNHVEMPVVNLAGHGDVRVYGVEEVRRLCAAAGLRLERGEKRGFFRLHCVARKPAEGVKNAAFREGNAVKLPFADESFDAVTSNYVYHNVMGKDKQELLLETLRVLKKGGVFAIHDIMSPARYGDMRSFADKLRAMGYETVELIDTTDGRFMSRAEAAALFLTGSTLLRGVK